MKIFIYKTLTIFILTVLFFNLTLGIKIREFKSELSNLKSDENIRMIKNKLRSEIKNAISKEKYLDQEDAQLIKDFIEKIQQEIK
tara:strand:- start:241 stop:495 length:255 start_codon:yes stop_codon:yes gene_type:complete